MEDEIEQAKTDQLWTDIFQQVFEINDSDWPQQVQRLRRIAELALRLAAVIEGATSDSPNAQRGV